jgi:flagellar biosynthesis/type III secretory pathway protein FliH
MGKRYEFSGPFMGFGFSEGEKLPESVAKEMKAMVNHAIDSHTVSTPKNDAEFNRGYKSGYDDGFKAGKLEAEDIDAEMAFQEAFENFFLSV